jgi:hypothetical protein
VPVLEGGPYDINPEGGLAAAGWLNFELDGPAVEDVEASPSLATLKDILNGSNQSKGNSCDVSKHAAGARAYCLLGRQLREFARFLKICRKSGIPELGASRTRGRVELNASDFSSSMIVVLAKAWLQNERKSGVSRARSCLLQKGESYRRSDATQVVKGARTQPRAL